LLAESEQWEGKHAEGVQAMGEQIEDKKAEGEQV
jgi:hypothetical protein